MRLERCACGRDILVRQDHEPQKVFEAVNVHNHTPEHTAWRAGMHLEAAGGYSRDGEKVKRAAWDGGELSPDIVDFVVADHEGTPNDGGVSQHIVGGSG